MRSNEEIIDLIVSLRTKRGMSLSELARRVGVAKSTLSRYENKSREFPVNNIEKYAEVLNVEPEFLLGIEVQKITDNPLNDSSSQRDNSNSITHLVDDLTEEETEEVRAFIEVVKGKRK